ncbi:MAG TPA: VOC family protein [Beijerinckiaceae bacterium]|nr:VOC family protein [Beijerinckiaceae bacterium]
MTTTAVKAGAYLHHVHLQSPQPERLAAFYGDAMDMSVERGADHTWLCSGPGRKLLVGEGPAKTLAHGAFACRDREGLEELRARAESEGLAPQAFSTALFAQDPFAVTDPDGNRIVFGLAAEEPAGRRGLKGPIQHLTLATRDVGQIEAFYAGKLGFAVSDRVRNEAGQVTTSFMRTNHEHHTLACFRSNRQGIDHHSYEAGEWNVIRDWADRFAERDIQLMWGPGRHGPGNNLFIFIEDPDGNWIEVSAELEVIHDRPVKEWPHAERTLNLWGRAIMRS